MMKKSIYPAMLCAGLFMVGCNQAADTAPTVPKTAQSAGDEAQNSPAPASMDPNILLTVNGQDVTKAMYGLYFQDRMRGVPEAQTSPQMQMSVLNELSNILLVAQDARKKGMDQREEVAATLELLKAKLLTQTAIQEYAKEHQPSENQIKTYYEAEYAGKTGKEYKARHILVKEEETAKDLIGQLDKGGDFAELAKQHSTGPTGKSGGDLGWFEAKQMVKPFSDAVVAMEKGSYTKAPVKTQFGWHVIQLEDARETQPPALESVRGEIINGLQQKSLAEYMQGLREQSKIVFNEANAVKKAPEQGESDSQESATAGDAGTAQADSASAEASGNADMAGGEKQPSGDAKPASE